MVNRTELQMQRCNGRNGGQNDEEDSCGVRSESSKDKRKNSSSKRG